MCIASEFFRDCLFAGWDGDFHCMAHGSGMASRICCFKCLSCSVMVSFGSIYSRHHHTYWVLLEEMGSIAFSLDKDFFSFSFISV